MPTTRGMLPSPRAPAAAHPWPAGGRARARTVGLGFLGGARAHLIQRRLARALAHIPTSRGFAARPSPSKRRGPAARDRDRLGGGIVDHRELGRAQAFDLVAQPRRLFEVEIG